MWLALEVNTNIGKAQIAFLNRLETSPSGSAIRKANPMAAINTYHFGLKVQSIMLTTIVINVMAAINKKREGSNHWNSLLA